ncbi:MAG: chemotaxis protein CheC [Planctomycetaceae bacterium]|jgi:chemotaxis protein CheC|nr:chemotaxis protein CheC [Planctomycetaceae bacterium]MBT6157368.1 chemotaxis protein CheC [Planctomycetaceae bacterium]MBT6483468.1 chemotaxis protein CheC [Planctomycetaceae bacterium]MBT6497088.1 chemotaxis protein CheC [Planctomycetaceae bacterium]
MTLDEIQLDALTEVINIGVGRAANSLSEITGSRIDLAVPNMYLCGTSDFSEIAKTLNLDVGTTIQQGFEGELSGRALLGFPRNNAFELACLVGDIQPGERELDEELCGVLEEIGNIVLNAVLGSIANMFDCEMSYTLPTFCTKRTFNTIICRCDDDVQSSDSIVLVANTSLRVASRDISGSLIVLFETGDIEVLLSALTDGMTV